MTSEEAMRKAIQGRPDEEVRQLIIDAVDAVCDAAGLGPDKRAAMRRILLDGDRAASCVMAAKMLESLA